MAYIIDSNSDDIYKDYMILKNELFTHNPELKKLPKLLLLSKIDIADNNNLLKKKMPSDIEILSISSITGKNLEKAIESIAYLVCD